MSTTNALEQVETPDYASIRDSFCEELKLATEGEKTSLTFIPNPLPKKALVKPGEIFQVFVLGATNGEIATVRYNADDTISIIDYRPYPELPQFDTVDVLLAFIDEHVDDMTNTISVNFAFPITPKIGEDGQLDGVMLKYNGPQNKGHEFKGLHDSLVGSVVADHFQRVHRRKVTVSVANDATCLLTSITTKGSDPTNLLAGIVGTGSNMAFFADKHTIINMESGNFNGFKPTSTGKIVDRESGHEGSKSFEKETAGGELYKHYNIIAKQYGLKTRPIKSSIDLNSLAITDQGDEGEVARALLRRSASLEATQYAGFYNFKGRPPKLTAIMQGSLFWNGANYKEIFVEELVKLGVPAEAILFEMLERSDIIGAAKLATSPL